MRLFISSPRPQGRQTFLLKGTSYCAFLVPDPCEYRDVSHLYPLKVLELKERLNYYRRTALPVVYPLISPKADPRHFNGFWSPWETLNDKTDYFASKSTCGKVQAKQVHLGLHLMHFSNQTV